MFNFKHFQTFSKYTLCVTFPAKKMLQVRFGERTRFFNRKLIFLDLYARKPLLISDLNE
jgi:hypothetical protein